LRGVGLGLGKVVDFENSIFEEGIPTLCFGRNFAKECEILLDLQILNHYVKDFLVLIHIFLFAIIQVKVFFVKSFLFFSF